MAEGFYRAAEKIAASAEPEKEIREYLAVGVHLYRYVRVRDRQRNPLGNSILLLAATGYLFDKPEWSYLAARMILCAVKTPHWFEGPQCCMEGSSWHHVCFTEETTISAISIAMGFLYRIFTKKAVEEICAAMAKHYETVVKCCKEEGYRRFSNQGIVGNVGRMIGACGFYALGDRRYAEEIEACYTDHTAMFGDYINEEHHCYEGGGYYQYSVGESIKLWKAYARYKQVELVKVIPKCVLGSLD